mmetsp:Transcript_33848/g.80789  ORF Transcript_33848/g.80789 Transcript_33848/m.80789 type:complete len:83 (-) Transcript_33848:284-532(-)
MEPTSISGSRTSVALGKALSGLRDGCGAGFLERRACKTDAKYEESSRSEPSSLASCAGLLGVPALGVLALGALASMKGLTSS